MKYLADSFFWIAHLNPRDAGPQRARQFTLNHPGARLYTTEDCLLEVLNHFSGFGPHTRLEAARFVRGLDGSHVRLLRRSPGEFDRAVHLCEQRPDKSYSLTDCLSMAVMRDLKLVAILSDDHHFTQEGFRLAL